MVCGTPAYVKCYSCDAITSVIEGVGMQQCMIQNQNEMHKLNKVDDFINNQVYSIYIVHHQRL